MKSIPFQGLYPSQLKIEWRKLGRRALRLWRASGGMDPEIDALFKRMDAVDKALNKVKHGSHRHKRPPLRKLHVRQT